MTDLNVHTIRIITVLIQNRRCIKLNVVAIGMLFLKDEVNKELLRDACDAHRSCKKSWRWQRQGAEGRGSLGPPGEGIIASGVSDVSWAIRRPGVVRTAQGAHPLLARVLVVVCNSVDMTLLYLQASTSGKRWVATPVPVPPPVTPCSSLSHPIDEKS